MSLSMKSALSSRRALGVILDAKESPSKKDSAVFDPTFSRIER